VIAIVPAIGADLAASQTELQWIADIFPLTVAALLLPAGAVLDRVGRKLGMLVGLAVLMGSLVWSASVGSASELIGARVASGGGMALIFPGTLATISEAMAGRRRMAAVGIWAVAGIVGGVGGMQLCALLADVASWREAFWAFAALSLVLFCLTAYGVPETRNRHETSFDPLGALLSIVAVGILVLGITEGPVDGWTSPVTVGGIVGGTIVMAGFVLWELRHPRPLLDVRVYRDPRFSAASIALFGMVIADFAMIFLVFQYEVYVLDYSPLKAALGISPPGLIMLVVVPLAVVLAPRWGERVVVTLALTACAAGTLISALVAGANASYIAMIAGTILIWAGIGFGVIAPTVTILDGLPRAKQGVASAVNDLTRELGAALGIAITGSAFNAGYRHHIEDALTGTTDAASTQAVLTSPAKGLATTPDGSGRFEGIVEHGVLQGWQTAFLVVSGVLILCAMAAWARYPRNRSPSASNRPETPDAWVAR
jgi:MFS family permease